MRSGSKKSDEIYITWFSWELALENNQFYTQNSLSTPNIIKKIKKTYMNTKIKFKNGQVPHASTDKKEVFQKKIVGINYSSIKSHKQAHT